MCLFPTVTKYRLGCSFEDSTIYPSPVPHPPSTPTPTPTIKLRTAKNFTFYSQRTLKNSTLKKRQATCLPCLALFLVPSIISSFLCFSFNVSFFLASSSVPSFRCIYFPPSHILSFFLSFWVNFIILLPSEKQYQGHKNSEHRNLFLHTSE